MTNIEIRSATPEDRPVLERWIVFVDSTFGNGLSPERPLAEVVKMISDEKAIVRIAVKNGAPIGYAGAYLYNASDATGLGTFVEPGMRRHGLSKALRESVEAELKAKGCKRVFGLISQYNEKGMTSAFSTGYRPVAPMVRKDL